LFELFIELGILTGIIVSTIYMAEARPVSRAVGGFIVLNMFLAILYLYLNCPYLAGIQVVIYTGAVAGLFLLAMSLTRPETPEERQEIRIIAQFLPISIIGFIIFLLGYFYYPFVPGFLPDSVSIVMERLSFNISELGSVIANYLWNIRGFDLLVQAFLVVAISAGLSHFFKKEGGEE